MKKILLGLSLLASVIVVLPGLAAFEAHVINVTATIENTLQASTYSLDFGTVFPQEKFEKIFDVSLSQSFEQAGRFDDVEYVLRQKPKCQLNAAGALVIPSLSSFGQATEDGEGNFVCKDEVNYDLMPFLCPYLSKAEITADGLVPENDMTEITPGHTGPLASFHGPLLLAPAPGGWNLGTTLAYQLAGRLAKSENDHSDRWNIDLKVPCFTGNHCAQDWASFVAANDGDNNANPNDYIQPIENEHKLFGCDLWVEVTHLSVPPTKGVLTVIKHVDNTNGGSSAASDFTMHVSGTNVSQASFAGAEAPGVDVTLDAGLYSVTEDSLTGYNSSSSAECSGAIGVGEHKTCTITNTAILACNAHADVMLVLDRSGSIDATELAQLKTAAHAFVTALAPTTAGAHMGQSSFSTAGTLDLQLTDNVTSINNAIDALVNGGNTDLEAGITLANGELASVRDRLPDSDGNFPDIMVIITDGNPNVPNATQGPIDARNAAIAARAAGVEVYVIGVGTDVDATYLINNIADDPAHYFSAADFSNLTAIFQAIANCQNPPHITGTLTVTKTVINDSGTGTSTASSFHYFASGIEVQNGLPINLVAGTYTVTESPINSVYTTTFGGQCNASGQVTIGIGENKSCTITNDDKVPQNLFSDNFGTGASLNDIPDWEEDGNDSASTTLASAISENGENTVSPDGGRFARIGNGEWMCREVNATGFGGLALKYYSRGDADAEDNESGFVEYRNSGVNCNGGGWTSVASHELDDTNNNVDEGWSSLQMANLPASLDNDSSFFVRFRNGANQSAESFRIDGVSLMGIAL